MVAASSKDPAKVEVAYVLPGSGAEAAGVRAGDAVVRVGGRDVDARDLPRIPGEWQCGEGVGGCKGTVLTRSSLRGTCHAFPVSSSEGRGWVGASRLCVYGHLGRNTSCLQHWGEGCPHCTTKYGHFHIFSPLIPPHPPHLPTLTPSPLSDLLRSDGVEVTLRREGPVTPLRPSRHGCPPHACPSAPCNTQHWVLIPLLILVLVLM